MLWWECLGQGRLIRVLVLSGPEGQKARRAEGQPGKECWRIRIPVLSRDDQGRQRSRSRPRRVGQVTRPRVAHAPCGAQPQPPRHGRSKAQHARVWVESATRSSHRTAHAPVTSTERVADSLEAPHPWLEPADAADAAEALLPRLEPGKAPRLPKPCSQGLNLPKLSKLPKPPKPCFHGWNLGRHRSYRNPASTAGTGRSPASTA